jgi:hypothetical protein
VSIEAVQRLHESASLPTEVKEVLAMFENRGPLLLTFTKNMLGLTENNLITSGSAGIM